MGQQMTRSKSKRTWRDLIRDVPTKEEEEGIEKFLDSAPDLALAILLAAGLEREIEDHIVSTLKRRDNSTIGMLVSPEGPLNSFSAKVIHGYAMGIYDDEIRHNLIVVAHIRNAFAHARKLIKFDDPEIIAELGRIRLPLQKRSNLHKDLQLSRSNVLDGRKRYWVLCTVLATQLIRRRSRLLKKSTRYFKKKGEYWRKRAMYATLSGLAAFPPPQK
jgi:DNA-binding MltR family transcriptional regulator